MKIFATKKSRKNDSEVILGKNVVIRDFVNLYGCKIGNDSRIGTFVEIQRGVEVGARCKISSHSFLCEGVILEDEVFVGHGVMFINDRYPRATNSEGDLKEDDDWLCESTFIGKGASIGSGSTILCGVQIGRGALVGAGSVVVKDVPAGVTVAGNPAQILKHKK